MKDLDLPGVVRRRLEQLDKSPAWLAQQSELSRSLVYAYLSTNPKAAKNLSWENKEKLFAALGLTISIEVTEKTGKRAHRKGPPAPDMPL
jgi:hypothetical protein